MRTQEERRGYVLAIDNSVAQMIEVSTGQSYDVALSAPGGVNPVVGDQWICRRAESGFWSFDRCVTTIASMPQASFRETMQGLIDRGLANPSYADGSNEAYHLAYIGEVRWFAFEPNDRWLLANGATVDRIEYRELAKVLDPPGVAVSMPGASGCYATATPSQASTSLFGDIEVVARVWLVDWTPPINTGFLYKDSDPVNRILGFYLDPNGFLHLDYDFGPNAHTSTVPVPFLNGTTWWIKATVKMIVPTNSHEVRFWYANNSAEEPKTWTQLGGVVTGASSASPGGAPNSFEIGGRSVDNDMWLNGRVHRVILRSGINGIAKLDFNAEDSHGRGSWVSQTTGETWNLQGAAAVVTLGAGPTFTIPSANNNDLNAGSTTFAQVPVSGAWTNYGGGFANFEYRRFGDHVELQGLANSTTANSGQTMGILPGGFQPIANHLFPALMNGQMGRVDVYPGGTVYLAQVPFVGPIASWVSVSGISFYSPAPFMLGTVRPYICARK